MATPCPDCPICQATARVIQTLQGDNFAVALTALNRSIAVKVAHEMRAATEAEAVAIMGNVEALMLQQLRENIEYELRQPTVN